MCTCGVEMASSLCGCLSSADPVDENEDGGSDGEDTQDLDAVNTSDATEIKRRLDEVAESVLFDDSPQCFQRDNFNVDVRLVLMGITCSFALVAQFFPLPMSEYRPHMIFLCIGYFVMSALLQIVTVLWEGDEIVRSLPDAAGNILVLRSTMHDLGCGYEVSIGILRKRADGKEEPVGEARSFKCSVGDFFTEKGSFWRAGYTREIEKLIPSFAIEKNGNSKKTN